MNDNITSILKVVCPWIGTAIGGPLGGLAVEAVSKVLSLSDKTTDAVKSAISGATPEQMLALQKADQDFKVQMQALGFKNEADLEAIAAGDRDSARKMQMASPSWIPAALSIIVTSGYFVVLIGMMTKYLSVTDSQVGLMMLGSLTTAWAGVLAYWMGTTRDSNNKTNLIAQSAPVK